jgi:GTP-binding protein Era
LGVHNTDQAQVVFLDTPGLHQPRRALNRLMVETALATCKEVDAVLFMADVTPAGMHAGARVAELLRQANKPTVLALNKIDLLPRKDALLPLMEQAAEWGPWKELVPLSALKNDGAGQVVQALVEILPPGPPLFGPEVITDLSLRFLAGELIREKVFRLTEREVPYAVAVTVDEYLEPANEGASTAITATIHVEKSGQKGIIIGKGGTMLKKIGSAARQEIMRLVGGPVYLSLFVRVEPRWSEMERGLRKLGY